mmetsp:Transcript_7483/g.12343  ORF Transcript_7483/g.12343 Transcript_7483/m.12343 type:complete len:211 (-) Transcript_7483:512-1144(-)
MSMSCLTLGPIIVKKNNNNNSSSLLQLRAQLQRQQQPPPLSPPTTTSIHTTKHYSQYVTANQPDFTNSQPHSVNNMYPASTEKSHRHKHVPTLLYLIQTFRGVIGRIWSSVLIPVPRLQRNSRRNFQRRILRRQKKKGNRRNHLYHQHYHHLTIERQRLKCTNGSMDGNNHSMIKSSNPLPKMGFNTVPIGSNTMTSSRHSKLVMGTMAA